MNKLRMQKGVNACDSGQGKMKEDIHRIRARIEREFLSLTNLNIYTSKLYC